MGSDLIFGFQAECGNASVRGKTFRVGTGSGFRFQSAPEPEPVLDEAACVQWDRWMGAGHRDWYDENIKPLTEGAKTVVRGGSQPREENRPRCQSGLPAHGRTNYAVCLLANTSHVLMCDGAVKFITDSIEAGIPYSARGR